MWRLCSIIFFCCLVSNLHAGADFILDVGLLSWALICIFELGPLLFVYLLCFTTLAIVSVLTKVSFLFVAAPTVLMLSLDLILRRRFPLGMALPTLFCFGLVLGWQICGQKLTHFVPYLAQGWEFAKCYPQCMSKQPASLILWTGVLTMIFSIFAIFAQIRWLALHPAAAWRKLIVLTWLGWMVFMSWKHGFVRLDEYHIELFAGFVIVLALSLRTFFEEPISGLWERGCDLLCITLSFFLIIKFFDVSPPSYFLFQPWQRFLASVHTLTHPSKSWREIIGLGQTPEMSAQLSKLQKLIGSKKIDVFGNQQAYASINAFNYLPRPVFQSYAAYSKNLLQLNRDFYSSSKAPELILFRLAAIDHRFPALEDGLLFPLLLQNCEMVDKEAQFLLLKPAYTSFPKLELLNSGTAKFGSPVTLSAYGHTNLWIELHVSPTLTGKITGLAFKTSALRLSVNRGPHKSPAVFQAPAPMIAAGFLASPLLLRNEDLAAFYADDSANRPEAYSLSCPDAEKYLWRDEIFFRIYAIKGFRSFANAK
jgi:hypothetical protein